MDAEKKKALEDAVADALTKAVEKGDATQAALYARVLEAVAALPVYAPPSSGMPDHVAARKIRSRK